MSSCTNESLGHLIAFYETGQLSEKEKITFEIHLLDCDFCRNELQQMTTTFDLMHEHRTSILQALGTTDAKPLLHPKEVKQPIFSRLKEFILKIFNALAQPEFAVASVVTILFASFLLTLENAPPSSPFTDLLRFEKAPYNSQILRSSEAEPGAQQFKSGMSYYLNDDFGNAALQLEKAVASEPENGVYRLYSGVCYFLQRQGDPAIDALLKAVNLNEDVLQNRSRWYLAQAYLLKADTARAREQLEILSAEQLEYSSEAEELLCQLDD
ncbi:hypothetical protein KKA08_07735 [bacterium]|nr:hypothetical protein [bacterium]